MLPVKSVINRELRLWDPFGELGRAHTDMDRLFASLWNDHDIDFSRPAVWTPSVEMVEDAKQFVVKAEVPGVSKDDISITLADDVLTLKGERKDHREERGEEKGDHTLFREWTYGTFQRTLPLPQNVKGDAVKADYKDGVLTITLPKTEESRSRKIKIDVK